MVSRPADLSQHAVPGVHTDLQLFEWIGDGFPGSRMPAFKSSLSEKDRWNLVNFIRTLAPKKRSFEWDIDVKSPSGAQNSIKKFQHCPPLSANGFDHPGRCFH
jgi:hypothetical protein